MYTSKKYLEEFDIGTAATTAKQFGQAAYQVAKPHVSKAYHGAVNYGAKAITAGKNMAMRAGAAIAAKQKAIAANALADTKAAAQKAAIPNTGIAKAASSTSSTSGNIMNNSVTNRLNQAASVNASVDPTQSISKSYLDEFTK